MKKIAFCLALFISFSALAETDKALWQILRHPLETEIMKTQIDARVKEGYLPSGLQVEEDKAMTILYVYNEKPLFDRWLLRFFGDMETLGKDCDALIDRGWVPVGISNAPEGVFLLFVNVPLDISGWTITRSGAAREQIKGTIQRYHEKGYSCYGISGTEDGKVWYIFLQTPKSPENSHEWLVLPNSPDEIKNGLDSFLALGWLPWGIMRREETYSILLLN